MKLETERLILRYATMKDAKDIAEQINNLNVSRYLLRVPYPDSLEKVKSYINHCLEKRRKRPQTEFPFSIELKEDKKVIGGGHIDFDEFQGVGEIGYWLGESYWGNGYGTEACKAILDYGFNNLKLRKIQIPVFADNQASNSLARKLGGVLEGTLRQQSKAKSTGEIHDENIYGILREEWMKTRKRLK